MKRCYLLCVVLLGCVLIFEGCDDEDKGASSMEAQRERERLQKEKDETERQRKEKARRLKLCRERCDAALSRVKFTIPVEAIRITTVGRLNEMKAKCLDYANDRIALPDFDYVVANAAKRAEWEALTPAQQKALTAKKEAEKSAPKQEPPEVAEIVKLTRRYYPICTEISKANWAYATAHDEGTTYNAVLKAAQNMSRIATQHSERNKGIGMAKTPCGKEVEKVYQDFIAKAHTRYSADLAHIKSIEKEIKRYLDGKREFGDALTKCEEQKKCKGRPFSIPDPNYSNIGSLACPSEYFVCKMMGNSEGVNCSYQRIAGVILKGSAKQLSLEVKASGRTL